MEVEECIKTRRSIRKFLDIGVPREKLVKILEAGRLAPNAGNLQNHEVIVVTEKPLRRAVAEACLQQYWIAQAPIILVVVAEHEVQKIHYGKRGDLYSVQSAACVAMNMILQAHELGLASCWVGAFDDEMIKRALGIPGKVTPLTVIPIGNGDESVPVPPRKSFYSTIWLEQYGNQIRDVNAALGDWSGVIEKKVRAAKEGAETHASRLVEHLKKMIPKKKK
jgi:nitroreductase